MPIYAYRCAQCGHAKDILQKMSDAPLTICPACNVEAFSKQVTAAGFALKGWTAYDYKNAAVYMNGDMALTIGHVILTDKNGKVTTVDKSWGFKKGADGKLRIVLHHSSLPYQPK